MARPFCAKPQQHGAFESRSVSGAAGGCRGAQVLVVFVVLIDSEPSYHRVRLMPCAPFSRRRTRARSAKVCSNAACRDRHLPSAEAPEKNDRRRGQQHAALGWTRCRQNARRIAQLLLVVGGPPVSSHPEHLEAHHSSLAQSCDPLAEPCEHQLRQVTVDTSPGSTGYGTWCLICASMREHFVRSPRSRERSCFRMTPAVVG